VARKSEVVKVPEWGGRDAGKLFKVTEMASARGEKWAYRALLLLSGSGGRIPENLAGRGMEAIAIIGINIFLQGSIRFEELEPLLDEMMPCVEAVRDPRAPHVSTPLVSDDDIEEVRTRAWLRSEVLRLHTGFSPADALFALILAINRPQLQESSGNT
jgi:hypothetical protein